MMRGKNVLVSRLILLAALVFTVGCTDSVTQVIVFIDAEPGVRAESDALRIKVDGRDGIDGKSVNKLDERVKGEALTWPLKLALAPAKDDPERVFWVEASALDGARAVASARLVSGYVEGETRYVKLVIEDECQGVTCADMDDTCHAGGCVPAYCNPRTLGK